VLVVLAAVAVLGGCAVPAAAARPPGPTDPYARVPAVQTTEAVPVPRTGEVGVVADGLAALGWFCARVRASDEVQQVWCRAPVDRPADVGSGGGDDAVPTVDVVATTDGDVGYLRTTRPDGPVGDDQRSDAELRELLDATVLTLWPEDAAAVTEVLTGARAHEEIGLGTNLADSRPPSRAGATTDHAAYWAGEGGDTRPGARVAWAPALTFVLATPALPDAPWPTGSDHAVRTPVEAAPGLEAGGFDCHGPQESPCTRPAGNQQVDHLSPFGRSEPVLAVRVGIGGGSRPDGSPTTLADQGLPQGLTFLTDEVRGAVEARVEQARLDGEPFVGLVAGAVVVLGTAPSPLRQPGEVSGVEVTVGAPLVTGVGP